MIQTATETKRTDICFTCALDEMFSGFNTARKVSRSSLVKVRITSMGILNICNLWILLRKSVIHFVGRKFYLRGLFRC